MSDFKPTPVTTLPKIQEQLTPEAEFWRTQLDSSKVVKEYGAINAIDVNPFTNDILISSTSRVSLYSHGSLDCKRSYSNPSAVSVFGGSFRQRDGKLLVTGDEGGIVHIYDVTATKSLRDLSDPKTKHLGPVHKTFFFGRNQIVSFSDEKSVKLWDVAGASLVTEFGRKEDTGSCATLAHKDYIRAGCVIESAELVVSGSYDHTVKVWDSKTVSSKPTHAFNMEVPVESVISKGSLIIASGGKRIVVYDLVAGKVVTTLTNSHSKTITCLCAFDKYILSGSIDGHVKVYDNLFKHVSTLSYSSSQILAVAANSKCVTVGTNDGTVLLRKFKVDQSAEPVASTSGVRITKRYFGLTTGLFEPDEDKEKKEDELDTVVIQTKRKKIKSKSLMQYDASLRRFNHSIALNQVLKKEKQRPHMVVSVLQELIRRSALHNALAGRSDRELKPIAEFLYHNIRDAKFNRILIEVATILTEIYTPHINRSTTLKCLFERLSRAVSRELVLMQQMKMLAGQISMITSNC